MSNTLCDATCVLIQSGFAHSLFSFFLAIYPSPQLFRTWKVRSIPLWKCLINCFSFTPGWGWKIFRLMTFEVARETSTSNWEPIFCSNINFDIKLTINLCKRWAPCTRIDKINTHTGSVHKNLVSFLGPPTMTIWCISFLSRLMNFSLICYLKNGEKLELI